MNSVSRPITAAPPRASAARAEARSIQAVLTLRYRPSAEPLRRADVPWHLSLLWWTSQDNSFVRRRAHAEAADSHPTTCDRRHDRRDRAGVRADLPLLSRG